MTGDRPVLGLLLMLGFCVLAPLGDSVAKLLGDRVALLQLVAARFALQAALLLPVIAATGARLRLDPRLARLVALRTALHMGGIGTMFLALRHLPLAEAIAIAFVMPFLMLLLGHLVLGEEVGGRRLAACAVGFAGTLLVVQPTFAETGAAALLPLLVAVFFALFMLVTRQLSRRIDAIALQCASGLMASALLLPLLALGAIAGVPGLATPLPGGDSWALLLAMGALGTLAHLLMTWSLRFAPAASLAPMQYLEIPVATALGLVIFGDLPDGLAGFGIAVTMAAGLYVIYREHRGARRPRRGPALPAPHPAPPAAAAAASRRSPSAGGPGR